MPTMEERYTVSEAADHLGVHRETLKRWEYEGKIAPGPRASRNNWRFYRPCDLERIRKWMEAVDEPQE